VPVAKLALQLVFLTGYGIFRDELYYIACADHLAWGYVDHPPFSIFVLWVAKGLFGDSLFTIRLVSAIAGALTVLLVGLMTRRLGGGSPAQLLAMLATTLAPIYLGTNHVFSMNTFELLIWAAAVYLLVVILDHGDPRVWLLLGLVLGLGLQNKISVLWLGAGIFVGFLASPQRRLLLSAWPWIGGLISALVFLPHVLWQIAHDWPTLEFMRNATQQKMAGHTSVEFLSSQILVMGPTNLIVWLPGLIWLLASQRAQRFRSLGWIYLVVLAILLVSGTSRSGYLSPAYTWLLAAGAVFWFDVLQERKHLFSLLTSAVGVGNLVLLPMAIPALSEPTYIRYASLLGMEPSTEEKKDVAELPQFYADMHGWRELAETFADVVDSLDPAERQSARILGLNYGIAGAVDYFGSDLGLPPAISGHNNYWLWGPGDWDGSVMVIKGASVEAISRYYDNVEQVATFNCDYCMPYEDNVPIFVGRDPIISVDEAWARLKNYD
jgi:hypothetical protein